MGDFSELNKELDKLSYQYEFMFRGVGVRPGQWIKFRNIYEPVVFVKVVHHRVGVSWIECRTVLNETKRLHPSKLEGVLFGGRMEKNGNRDRRTRPLH